jgi:tetratricopeptide (TPR) repeat protein
MVIQCLGSGEYDEAIRFGQEALSIARTLDDRSIEVVATHFLGMTHAARGEFSHAVTFLERYVVLQGDLRYERFGTPGIPSAVSEAHLADVLSQLGRFDEAIGHAEAALQIAETADHPFTLFNGLLCRGLVDLRRGDVARAIPFLERCLHLCRTSQIVGVIPVVAATLGAAYALAGRADESLPLVAGAVEEFRGRQIHTRPALIPLWAGMIYLSVGRIDDAARHAREALALTRRLGARGSEAHALCLVGDVASAGRTDEADSRYGEALALANELGMRPLVAHCHLGLSKLYRRTDKREQAGEHLATATTMYRDGHDVLAGEGGSGDGGARVMHRRRFLLTSLAGALAAPLAVEAQPAGKVYRIGYLSGASLVANKPFLEQFQQGLWELAMRRVSRRLTREAVQHGKVTAELEDARRQHVPTFTHFLDIPIFFVIVALGAMRPNSWTLFATGMMLALVAAAVLTLVIPRLYPFELGEARR